MSQRLIIRVMMVLGSANWRIGSWTYKETAEYVLPALQSDGSDDEVMDNVFHSLGARTMDDRILCMDIARKLLRVRDKHRKDQA